MTRAARHAPDLAHIFRGARLTNTQIALWPTYESSNNDRSCCLGTISVWPGHTAKPSLNATVNAESSKKDAFGCDQAEGARQKMYHSGKRPAYPL